MFNHCVPKNVHLFIFNNCIKNQCLQCFDAVGWAAGTAYNNNNNNNDRLTAFDPGKPG